MPPIFHLSFPNWGLFPLQGLILACWLPSLMMVIVTLAFAFTLSSSLLIHAFCASFKRSRNPSFFYFLFCTINYEACLPPGSQTTKNLPPSLQATNHKSLLHPATKPCLPSGSPSLSPQQKPSSLQTANHKCLLLLATKNSPPSRQPPSNKPLLHSATKTCLPPGSHDKTATQ